MLLGVPLFSAMFRFESACMRLRAYVLALPPNHNNNNRKHASGVWEPLMAVDSHPTRDAMAEHAKLSHFKFMWWVTVCAKFYRKISILIKWRITLHLALGASAVSPCASALQPPMQVIVPRQEPILIMRWYCVCTNLLIVAVGHAAVPRAGKLKVLAQKGKSRRQTK